MTKLKNSRLSPVSRKLQTLALKQLALGQYGYAVNALYSKQAVRDELLQCEAASVINVRCYVPPRVHLFCGMCLHWDWGSSQKLPMHVAELDNRAPVLHAVLSSAVWKNPTVKENLTDVQEPNRASEQHAKIVSPISVAKSILLKSRCPQMSAQAYRLSTVLWHSGAKKQVS